MLRHFMFDVLSNMSIKTASVILAAGKGTRMRSNIPKVLHALAGRPLMEYALDLGLDICSVPPIVVVGFESEKVQEVPVGRQAPLRAHVRAGRPLAARAARRALWRAACGVCLVLGTASHQAAVMVVPFLWYWSWGRGRDCRTPKGRQRLLRPFRRNHPDG